MAVLASRVVQWYGMLRGVRVKGVVARAAGRRGIMQDEAVGFGETGAGIVAVM